MNLKLKEIVGMYEGINSLADKELPVRCSLILANNAFVLEEKVKLFDGKRKELMEKYGEKDENGKLMEDGGILRFANNIAQERFVKDYEEMLDTNMDVNLEMLDVEMFGNTSVTPQEMATIRKIVKA